MLNHDFPNRPTPPHSIEAEQATLHAAMKRIDVWNRVSTRLVEEDFFLDGHRALFRAIGSLVERNVPLDSLTLAEWLTSNNGAAHIPVLHAIAGLAPEGTSLKQVEAYAEIVRGKSVLRKLVATCDEISKDVFQGASQNIMDILDLAQARLFDVVATWEIKPDRGSFSGMKASLKEAFKRIHDAYEQGGRDPESSLSTGISELDCWIPSLGFEPGCLAFIAGHPSNGESELALNIVRHTALEQKKSVAVFSLTRTVVEYATNLISSTGLIDLQHLREGNPTDDEWPVLTSAITRLNDAQNIFLNDTEGLSILEVCRAVRKLKREHDIRLVVIDGMRQLRELRDENRSSAISEVTQMLKNLAQELDILVLVVLSVPHRETDLGGQPSLANLHEFRAIEQAADLVLFVHREESYNPESLHKGTIEVHGHSWRNGGFLPAALLNYSWKNQRIGSLP